MDFLCSRRLLYGRIGIQEGVSQFDENSEVYMAQIERICTNCGTSNPSDRTHCLQCGMDLIHLPAPQQTTMPTRIDQARAAALIVGASALILRAGLQLFARGILPRLVDGWVKPSPSAIEERRAEDQSDWIVKGWRAWSFHSGDTHSTGSERFEWRIKRTRER